MRPLLAGRSLAFGVGRCFGPTCATFLMKRSKRSHASGSSSTAAISSFGFVSLGVFFDMPTAPLKPPPLYDLSRHPEYTDLLGKIAAAYSLTEYHLADLFMYLLRAVPQRARAAFYAVNSNSARLTMLRSIVKDARLDPWAKRRVPDLLDLAQQAAHKRNAAVHRLWLLHNGEVYGSENIDHEFPYGHKRAISSRELRDTLDTINRASIELVNFNVEYSMLNPVPIRDADTPRALRKTLPKQHRRPRPSSAHSPSSPEDEQPTQRSSRE